MGPCPARNPLWGSGLVKTSLPAELKLLGRAEGGVAGRPGEHAGVQSDGVGSAKTSSKEMNVPTQNEISISLTKLDFVIARRLLSSHNSKGRV